MYAVDAYWANTVAAAVRADDFAARNPDEFLLFKKAKDIWDIADFWLNEACEVEAAIQKHASNQIPAVRLTA